MSLTKPKIAGTVSKKDVLGFRVNRLSDDAGDFGGTTKYKVHEVQQDDSVLTKEKTIEVVWTAADKANLAKVFPSIKAAIAAAEGVSEEVE